MLVRLEVILATKNVRAVDAMPGLIIDANGSVRAGGKTADTGSSKAEVLECFIVLSN